MIFSSNPQPRASDEHLRFIEQKIGVSEKALSLGLRQADLEQAPLPIVLWSFGLLNLSQLEQVFEWQSSHE